ncbi:hypothetical protein KP509_13G056400 [Ceratopteris richardii]|uniref:RING-type domain-containing protein n=1 Tax=Ceratopteris richardii TaxID=49495 RepID=A0A8T2THV2_CERRI|nr:hypothetical protein KP509_13G056400 [Ceratopteris richardii]
MPSHGLQSISFIGLTCSWLLYSLASASASAANFSGLSAPVPSPPGAGSRHFNKLNACNTTPPANGTSLLADQSVSSSGSTKPSYSPAPTAANPKPSIILIIIVLLTAFSSAGVLSIYIQHNCFMTSDSSNTPISDMTHAVPTTNPDNNSHLQQEDKQCLRVDDKDLSAECAVCLSVFEEAEELCLLPQCGHYFHKDCIDMWFFSHLTCPLCRRSVRAKLKEVRDPDQYAIDISLNINANDVV